MMKIDRKHHKIIKTDTAWGTWEYTYHERYVQERKAKKVMREGCVSNDNGRLVI